jgi:hypothetical protein
MSAALWSVAGLSLEFVGLILLFIDLIGSRRIDQAGSAIRAFQADLQSQGREIVISLYKSFQRLTKVAEYLIRTAEGDDMLSPEKRKMLVEGIVDASGALSEEKLNEMLAGETVLQAQAVIGLQDVLKKSQQLGIVAKIGVAIVLVGAACQLLGGLIEAGFM